MMRRRNSGRKAERNKENSPWENKSVSSNPPAVVDKLKNSIKSMGWHQGDRDGSNTAASADKVELSHQPTLSRRQGDRLRLTSQLFPYELFQFCYFLLDGDRRRGCLCAHLIIPCFDCNLHSGKSFVHRSINGIERLANLNFK